MRCLIFGDSGFVGKHLRDCLENYGYDVYGFDRHNGDDLRNYEDVHRAIEYYRPDWIFHLAAMTFVPESFHDPRRAYEINTLGSLNILEAVRKLGLKTKIHLAGTSEEYGDTSSCDPPITELSLPTPLSPYAISKLAMDLTGQLYARSYGMHVVVTRAFNHCGPGRGEMFAESAFAKQIAEIERGKRDILYHGNLESIRNYTDVRDIVRGYVQAIELPPGVYNLCSDRNVSMVEMLEMLFKYAKVPIKTEVKPELYRPVDFSFKEPSCEKFTNLTGWKPTIPLEQTLLEILEDWRIRLI